MGRTNRRTMYLLMAVLLFCTSGISSRKVDCIKYIYAPVCRGAASKRDMQKLEPLFEEPRTPRYQVPNELELSLNSEPFSSHQSKDNDRYNRKLFDVLLQKISPNDDYDTGTNNNY